MAVAVHMAAVAVRMAAVDSMEVGEADSTAVAVHMVVAHSAEAPAEDIHSAAVADHSAASGAAPRAGDHLAADDQRRLVFAVVHLEARGALLLVRAGRSEMGARVPTASME